MHSNDANTNEMGIEALRGLSDEKSEELKAKISKAIKPDLDIETLPPLLTEPKKVLLITPPGSIDESYGRLSSAAGELPMLGLAYIAASLRDQGHEVKVVDCEIEGLTLAQLNESIRSYAPDVVGMTVYITNMLRCSAVAKAAKEIDPNITVVFGGPQVSIFPEEGLKSPDVDILVLSEGEVVIRNVMNALKDDDKLSQVRGIWFRGADGKIVRGVREGLVTDLDVLPSPALDLFPMEKYYPPVYVRGKRVAHMLTSRGCPFKCTFCETKLTFGRSFRYHSTERVLQDMKVLIDRGYDSFQFYDDIFTANKKRVIDLCEGIIERGWNIKFMCYTRTNCISDDMLEAMKKAGCYMITFGAESGNDDLLKIIRKDLTVETNYEGIRMTRKHGILTFSSFMIGLPGETEEHTKNTVNFAMKSGLDYAIFPITEPYPGTEMWVDAQKYGTFDFSGKYQNNLLSENAAVWIPTGRSREELEKTAVNAMARFYFRPRQILIGFENILHAPFGRAMRYFLGGMKYFLTAPFKVTRAGSRY